MNRQYTFRGAWAMMLLVGLCIVDVCLSTGEPTTIWKVETPDNKITLLENTDTLLEGCRALREKLDGLTKIFGLRHESKDAIAKLMTQTMQTEQMLRDVRRELEQDQNQIANEQFAFHQKQFDNLALWLVATMLKADRYQNQLAPRH